MFLQAWVLIPRRDAVSMMTMVGLRVCRMGWGREAVGRVGWLGAGSEQRRRVHENHDWFASLPDWMGGEEGRGALLCGFRAETPYL